MAARVLDIVQNDRLGRNAAGDPSAALRMTDYKVSVDHRTLLSRPNHSLSSRLQWRDLNQLAAVSATYWGLRGWVECGRRSFGCAQDDKVGCLPGSATFCYSCLNMVCHPGRSGGISASWQQYLRLTGDCGVGWNAAGDPSAALRMTKWGVFPAQPPSAIRASTWSVIPTAVEGSQPVSRKLTDCLRDSSYSVFHRFSQDSLPYCCE